MCLTLLSDSYCPFGKSFPLRYRSSESVEGAVRGRMRGKDERGRMWEGEDLRGGGCERGRMRGRV